ncbi:MAG: 16S rRNA (guanine(966)-N(2))-methyltransferase RsmD [Pseudomonadales bacterium]
MSQHTKSRTPKSRSTQSNHLRIIAGKWRGRKVQFPDSQGLRPTSDRVRETLFNWLAPVINEARCLDLFSGSGALSLEALSRGAAKVTMIDANARVSEQLRQNLKLLECDNADLLTTDAIKWLKQDKATTEAFDVVFLDPPFNQQLVAPSCELLDSQGLVEDGSYIYIETEAGLELQIPSSWQIHREKKAGQVAYYLCIKGAG